MSNYYWNIRRDHYERRVEGVASNFPHNMTVEILSRLSVKSLIRFKCVSKSWYNMISSRSFQGLQSRRSQRNLRFLFRSATLDYDYSENHNHKEQRFPFFYNFFSLDTKGVEYDRFVAKVDGPIKLLLTSCYGLVCFATLKRVYLCNPSIHQLLPLPACPWQSYIAGFGLGYLVSTKEFKVVRLICRKSLTPYVLSNDDYKVECSVFSLVLGGREGRLQMQTCSSSWRVLNENPPYFVEEFGHSAFANETIYWKINRARHPLLWRNNDFIVSFNIRHEKFQTITHPPDWRFILDNLTQLVELRGMLCMIETSTSHVLIWLLTDHHNCIWSKVSIIDLAGIDRKFFGEVKSFHNGEIIFSSFINFMFYYDTKKKTFRQPMLPFRAFEFATYRESFVSLPSL